MSREILFRAKCIDNGHSEWVEGNLVYTPENDDDFRYIIIPKHNNGMYTKMPDLGLEKWYKVDPSTVCQYTGLTDKEGKPIFENDYFRVDEKCEFVQKEYNGYVKYGQHNTFHVTKESEDFNVGFYVNWDDGGYRSDLAFWAERYNVAGNIFDKNP